MFVIGTLSAPIVSATSLTAIPISPAVVAIPAGTLLNIGYPGVSDPIVTAAPVAVGGVSITVSSFTATVNYPLGALVVDIGSAPIYATVPVNVIGKIGGEDLVNDVMKVASEVLEQSIALPALTNIFVDSASVVPLSRAKTIYLVVATALTWVTSGQATWTPFASRAAFAAAVAATTSLTTSQVKLGAANNLGAAAQTSLPAGLYRLSPATVAELQWTDAQIGVELQFPSALTGGAATLFLEVA